MKTQQHFVSLLRNLWGVLSAWIGQDRMCIDLTNSRNEAKLLQDSDDCRVKENA